MDIGSGPRLLALVLMALSACHQPTRPTKPATTLTATSLVDRPNVVVILTDDQEVGSMRVMTQTRNLIGSLGVTFTNSMVTYALCCPSRATLLTGQYPHNHGVRSNTSPDGGHAALDHTNALPVWLQAAGYVTAWIGKYLNEYGRIDQLELVPGWTEWYLSTGNTDSRYFSYLLNENGTVVSYGSATEQYKTDVFTNKAVDFIRRRAGGEEPFFLVVSHEAPHGGGPVEPGDPKSVGTPAVAPRHKGLFASEPFPVFPSFNEADMRDKPASMRSRGLLSSTQIADLRVAHRQRLESLLSVDEGIARVIDALQSEGVLENTLVIFTSDNGWFQGQHRIRFGKTLPYEAAVKVPLLIRGPGVAKGLVNSAPVANVDLAPTIVGVAGATPGRIMDGRSLHPLLSGTQTTWNTGNGPRHVLVEDSQLGELSKVFWSIKRGTLVYTEYANGDREFYNLRNDPDQMTSRHNDPTTATVRRQLTKRLAAMKSCVGPTACW